jgi:hypothetical protein
MGFSCPSRSSRPAGITSMALSPAGMLAQNTTAAAFTTCYSRQHVCCLARLGMFSLYCLCMTWDAALPAA